MSGNAFSTSDDAGLVKLARQGELGAFEELVARHRDKIYARALSLTRNEDEALDLSQTAWVKGWQRLEQFHGEAGFTTWMTRIVINLCLDHLRRQKRLRTDSLEAMAEANEGLEPHLPVIPVNPTAGLERTELRQVIDGALGQLSAEHRMVLVLHEFEEMEYKDIAKTMGCSMGTVMSRLFYARRKMAGLLAGWRKRNMNLEAQLNLQSFLDGELPPDEARAMAGLIQRDPAAAALLAELKATRQTLRQAEPPVTMTEAREFYWSKIERDIARPAPRPPARPVAGLFEKLRWLVLPTAVAAVLAVVGLTMHFHTPPAVAAKLVGDEATTVETALASTDATTYRDPKEGTTLVWFSDTTAVAPDAGTNGAN